MTLGSLFDGIGGFPLAASRLGITPLWASEIEAAAVSITKKHFPDMLHLGNITEISGAEIEPVDIITFGSPCQDLSVAGKRAGLDGERSGLFLEAVRIIKEMREATCGVYPTYAIWENVPGAFTSNKGEDFRTVAEEIARIAEPGISVARPKKWPNAGAVVGEGHSLAWRVLDAQYWGVPQRRRRIFLVADFGGGRAGEVLFKPDGVRGDYATCGEAGEGTSADAAPSLGGTGATVMPINTQAVTRHKALGERTAFGMGGEGDPAYTLQEGHSHGVIVLNDQGGDSVNVEKSDVAPTLRAETHGNLPIVYDARGNGSGKVAPTIVGDHQNRVTDYTALAVHQNQCGEVRTGDVANTISTNGNASGRNAPLVAIGIDGEQNAIVEKMGTIRAHSSGGNEHCVGVFAMQGFGDYKESESASALKSRDFKDATDLVGYGCAVRRLTPTECERLQGFPDGWTAHGHDGRPISDTQRYRALGNSVAIPCVEFIMGNIRGVM